MAAPFEENEKCPRPRFDQDQSLKKYVTADYSNCDSHASTRQTGYRDHAGSSRGLFDQRREDRHQKIPLYQSRATVFHRRIQKIETCRKAGRPQCNPPGYEVGWFRSKDHRAVPLRVTLDFSGSRSRGPVRKISPKPGTRNKFWTGARMRDCK